MILITTTRFDKDFEDLPDRIKKAARKAFQFLETNPHHPSLNTSKLDEDLWYCRVTDDYRMSFNWIGDEITLRVIDSHDKALRRSLRLPPLL